MALIADTHAHWLWGEPTFLQTNIADWVSASAIRTPEGDLWGPFTERWFLDRMIHDEPIVHLGDAADIACEQEYTVFLQLMQAHKQRTNKPWFQAPGNHDAYFYGNYYDVESGDGDGDWYRACSGHPLTKPTLVRWYLSALVKQVGKDGAPDVVSSKDAAKLEKPKDDLDPDHLTPVGDRLLTAIAWNASYDQPWTSYIVQQLELTNLAQTPPPVAGEPPPPRVPPTPVIAILLDTAVYDYRPQLIPLGEYNAGLTGDISDEEASVVRNWAAKAKERGAVVVLMGHHPYGALTDRGKSLLDDLHAHYGAVLYVSAHDHSGKWTVDGQGSTWPELNIGAMVDEPSEIRDFALLRYSGPSDPPTGHGRIAIRSTLWRMDQFIDVANPSDSKDNGPSPHCSRLDGVWDAPPDASDYYVSYRGTGEFAIRKTQLTILNVLLGNWERFLGVVARQNAKNLLPWPSDWASQTDLEAWIRQGQTAVGARAKMAALRSIIQGTPLWTDSGPQSKTLNTFAVCQGWWGTKYEFQKRRNPDPNDRGLVLPE